MNPMHFGASERPLFGIHHPPTGRGARDLGVVLCYPLGVEYMRAHRAFRQLATLLARAGMHVFRFDYYGTGDSAGDWDEGSLEGWRDDVGRAITELQEMTGVPAVSLVGLRLGGTLALMAADRAAAETFSIERVILWDPVVSGAEYLDGLLGTDIGTRFWDERERIGARGYPMTRRLHDELMDLSLEADVASEGPGARIVLSGPDPSADRLAKTLESRGRLEGTEVVPSRGSWVEGDAFGSVLLPQGIIGRIVERLQEKEIQS